MQLQSNCIVLSISQFFKYKTEGSDNVVKLLPMEG